MSPHRPARYAAEARSRFIIGENPAVAAHIRKAQAKLDDASVRQRDGRVDLVDQIIGPIGVFEDLEV